MSDCPPEPTGTPELATSGPLTLVLTDSGILATGPAADGYLAEVHERLSGWGQPVAVSQLTDAAAALSTVAVLGMDSGGYVQLSERSLALLQQHDLVPGQTSGFFQGSVRDAHGQFAGNLEFQNVSMAASQAAALQLAAVTLALRVAIQQVQRSVEQVAEKTDELVARARANDAGPVIAHHAVLTEMTAALDRDGALPATDWDTVQSLGVHLPSTIETLRAYVFEQIKVLDASASAPERAKQLRGVVHRAQIGRMLDLLLVAEDSHYRWQRLRLERLRSVEPEHLPRAIGRANARLRDDLERDDQLVKNLAALLDDFGSQRPLERLNPLSIHSLEESVAALRHDLERFREARQLQIAEWREHERPTLGDAAREVAGRALGSGRWVLGRGKVVAGEVGRTAVDTKDAIAFGAGHLKAATLDRVPIGRKPDETPEPIDRPPSKTPGERRPGNPPG